jgi:hypothetical protein
MSVKTLGHYHWHKVWHDDLMSDGGYARVGLLERGAYSTLCNLAGSTNNSGSMRVGMDAALNIRTAAEWLVDVVPGAGERKDRCKANRALLRTLVKAGLLVVRGEKLCISSWAEEQKCAPSMEAARQRRCRALRNKDLSAGDEGGRGMGESPREFFAAVPPPAAGPRGAAEPPLPPSTSTDFEGIVTHHAERDMSHRGEAEEIEDERRKKESFDSRTSISKEGADASTGGRGGSAAGSDRSSPMRALVDPKLFPFWPQDEKDEAAFERLEYEQLVAAAMDLCKTCKTFDKNTYSRQLRLMEARYGQEQAAWWFKKALGKVHRAIVDKIARKPAALMNHELEKCAQGLPNSP